MACPWQPTSATAASAPQDVAASLVGAVVKDPVQDRVIWQEYLETVVRNRPEWKDLYRACRDLESSN